MSTALAVLVSIALWVGCLWDAPVGAAGAAIGVLLGAVTLAVRRGARAAIVPMLVAMVLLGGGLAGGRLSLRERSPLVDLASAGRKVTIAGRVVTEPRATAFGAWAVVRVREVDGRSTATRGVLQLDLDDEIAVGQPVVGLMGVTPLPEGGFGRYLRTLGAAASIRPVGPLWTGTAPLALRWTTDVRDRARRVFDSALDDDRAALLSGLVLGTRDGIDDDALRDSGLSHLVVVSGRHVAVLLAGLLAVVSAAGVGHRSRHGLALAGLWWFVVLTRWQPSVLRAAVMATLTLVAAFVGRDRDTLHTLAVTVTVLLLIDPWLARQAGFALSVLATAGVLIALRCHPQDEDPSGRRKRLATAIRVTLAAQLSTAPVLLGMAGTVPLAALPANVIAAPAATIAQVLGLVAAALAAPGLPGGVVLAGTAGPPLAVLQWAATAFADLPRLTAWSLPVVVLMVGCTLLLRRRVPHRAGVRLVVAGVWTGLAVVVVGPLLLPPRAPPSLRLTVLDVGQGDALLVEAPDGDGGARMLVDGGREPAVVDRLLRDRRIRALDVVVATHGDDDHTGGLARAVSGRRIGMLLVPSGDPALREGARSARDTVAAARGAGVPVSEAHAGQRFALGSAMVEVLAPELRRPPGAGRNSRSIVLRVADAHGAVLLTGDADETAQQRLLRRPEQLEADVLKVPHHGGATNAPRFLDAVGASTSVVSVGADNRYGHPHPDTVADIAPVPLWRTDRHGTITVTLTPEGPLVEPERQPAGAG